MLLAQKKPEPDFREINEAIRLFSELADLDYESGYNDHTYFQYLSNSKDDIALLDAYHPNEIFDKYIVQVAGKGFTLVDHLSKIYGMPDTHECIDKNLPLRLVLDINARQKLFFSSGHLYLKKNKINCFKKNKMQDYDEISNKALAYIQR